MTFSKSNTRLDLEKQRERESGDDGGVGSAGGRLWIKGWN